jgi:segregation and condensation protein B
MSIKAKLEALVYAADDPITLDQMAALLKDDLLALKGGPAVEPHPELADQHLGAVETDGMEAVTQESADEVEPSVEGSSTERLPSETMASPEETGSAAASEAAPTSKAARKNAKEKSEKVELRELLKPHLEQLIADFEQEDRGIEIRQVAGGYRMSTKPEHHDVVRSFSKSLKPPIRLSLQSLETLAVIAYKQPVTVPEISDIRGVDSSGVIGTLLDRKLITTAGRKAVVGRPMLYKTTKDFLLRFGLKDVSELPSLEEFEKLAAREMQDELFAGDHSAMADATGTPTESNEAISSTDAAAHNGHTHHKIEDGGQEQLAEDKAEAPQTVTEPTVSSDPKHNKTDEQVADQIASESSGG